MLRSVNERLRAFVYAFLFENYHDISTKENEMHPLKRRSKQLYELTAEVYKRDIRVKFSRVRDGNLLTEQERERQGNKRSKIIRFSWKSARRLRHLIRNSEDIWKAFITLTYPADYPCNGRETKAHLNAFLQFLRRKGVKSVWVLEFQSRGAPHYHIIVSEFVVKEEIAERWYKVVGSGDEKHLRAGTGINAIRSKGHLYGYLSSYIKKLDQKIPPEWFEDVGRFWGSSRNLLVFETSKRIAQYWRQVWGIKLLRNWYAARLRQFGIKWKWKGMGFTALDGIGLVQQIRALKC